MRKCASLLCVVIKICNLKIVEKYNYICPWDFNKTIDNLYSKYYS